MASIPIIQTVVAVVTRILRVGGYPGLVGLMTVESFGIPPIPSEVILPFAGFLVVLGVFTYAGALTAATIGCLLGAFSAYAVGRWGRDWLVERAPRWLRIEPRHLARMDAWFAHWGEGTVAAARLAPIVRAYISYPAGTARMDPVRFGVYTLVGGLPYSAGLLYAGLVLRSHWNALVPYFNILDLVAVAGIALTVALIVVHWHREGRRRRARPATPPTPPP